MPLSGERIMQLYPDRVLRPAYDETTPVRCLESDALPLQQLDEGLLVLHQRTPESLRQDSGRGVNVQTVFFRREHDASAPESVQEKSGVHTTNLSRSPDDVRALSLTSVPLFSAT